MFLDDADRAGYLKRLGEVTRSAEWRCLAYCLMGNHVHLLLEMSKPNLSEGMQRLHGPYTQRFNARHERVGHLFQGRFHAVRVEDDAQLMAVARYIARNPVEAKLCSEPEDWPWSSFSPTLPPTTSDWLDISRLLDLLGMSLDAVVGKMRGA